MLYKDDLTGYNSYVNHCVQFSLLLSHI